MLSYESRRLRLLPILLEILHLVRLALFRLRSLPRPLLVGDDGMELVCLASREVDGFLLALGHGLCDEDVLDGGA